MRFWYLWKVVDGLGFDQVFIRILPPSQNQNNLSSLEHSITFMEYRNLVFPQWSIYFFNYTYFQEFIWRYGDIDAKIFPHIRCRLPSFHLYLAPLLTIPSGCSTVVRDYWQPSSCSQALFFSHLLCLFRSLRLLPPPHSLSMSLSTLSCRANKDAQSAASPENITVCTTQKCLSLTW